MGYLAILIFAISAYLVPSGIFAATIQTVGTGLETADQIKIVNSVYALQATIDYVISSKVDTMMELRKDMISTKADNPKWKDLSKMWEKQKKMQKAMSSLSTLSTALGAAGCLASFAFGIFADSETAMLAKQMTAEFKTVNSKLDGLYAKLGSVEDSLQNYITADTDTQSLTEFTNVIKNGIDKKNEILDKVNDLNDNYIPDTHQQEMMYLFEEFKQFYEQTLVDSNIKDLVRLVNLNEPRPAQRTDIFTTVREVVYCDISALQNLYLFIENYLTQAGQVKFV